MTRIQKLRRRGLWIALYGPDGAGKSAVAARIATELASLFRGVQLHHLRIPLGRCEDKVTVITEPHAQPPRGLLLSCLKLSYMFAQSWLAHLVHVLVWLARGQLVLSDRYFLDYAVDPRRYRLTGATVRLASLLGDFSPQPDLQFVLDVPAAELQRRKPEVSLAESQRQRHEYAARIARLPNAILVNGERPLGEVASDVGNTILQLLNDRAHSIPRSSSATFQDAAR